MSDPNGWRGCVGNLPFASFLYAGAMSEGDKCLSMRERNCDAIRQTLERHGIEFLGTNGLRINR